MTIARFARAQAHRLFGESNDDQLSVMPIGPREGWISVIALTAMMVVTGLAIDEARWAGSIPRSVDSQTGFLPFVAIFSTLLGIGLAKSRLSKLAAYAITIVLGAVTLLIAISSAISLSPSIGGRLHDLNLSVATFVQDVFVRGQPSQETSIFLLLLGSVLWGAGVFCAFAAFRYHRPAPVVLLSGLILLVNVSVTIRDQYVYLIAFTIAALLLIVRLNVLQQIHSWRVLDLGDVGEVSTAFMRNGAAFVAVAIVASTVLAANASSAPLSHAWHSADEQLLELGTTVNRWLGGVSGQARGPNILFTPTQTIRGVWESSSDLVFTAATSDLTGYRWRGATYDSFDGRSWEQLDRTAYTRPADANIADGAADAPRTGAGLAQVTVQVTPANYGGDTFVSAGSPISVDQPSEVITSGTGGPFVEGRLTYGILPDQPYTVTAVVDQTHGNGALAGNWLASAGTDYPAFISRYLDIRPDSIGPVTVDLAKSLVNQLPAEQRDPYHIAIAFQDYLYRAGGFQYNTDVRGLCDGQLLVDCFLQTKQGYCEYFATAMVMMLRAVGIPARYAVGYLPGRQQADGSWRVESDAAHAWVEVYFPSFGWVEFDPTPGNQENGQHPAQFVGAAPIPVASPGAIPSGPPANNPECIDPLDPTCNKGNLPIPPVTRPGSPLGDPVLIAILAVLLLGGGGALFFLFRLVRLAEPEAAFDGVARLARRLGYGPQPAQTTYEYAERLSELVPVARSDLGLIALAKVEATYGRRRPNESVLTSLANAYRRVRVGLLRLVFRRPRLRRPR